MTTAQRRLCESFAKLVYGNPFLPERIEAERRILGPAFIADEPVWSLADDFEATRPNVIALAAKSEGLSFSLRDRLRSAEQPSAEELDLYIALGSYVLYYRNHQSLLDLAEAEIAAGDDSISARLPRGLWDRFVREYGELFIFSGKSVCPHSPVHLLALCFQTRRAFVHVFNGLVGGSEAAARLRAEVWHSIFTHDRQRYARTLWDRMRDLPTLITGESGTGKEIVAGSIARSQYRPFDEKTGQFAPPGEFVPLNLSALPSTLIESELFGHKRGSFTGATADRRGWLETVGPGGCVFLDEVGDMAPEVQVKLLRVLQDRSFVRVGETKPRRFAGKIMAATNHDLAADMSAGRFRQDLYYRLSGDLVRTPTLREQISGDEAELRRLLLFVARRVVGGDEIAREALVNETLDVTHTQLGMDYPWPGNFRELEQCVRNVLVRRTYTPARARVSAAPPDFHALPSASSRGFQRLPSDARTAGAPPAAPAWDAPAESDNGDLASAVTSGALTADQLLTRYIAHVYHRLGTYEATARRLGIDRRTVKARVAQHMADVLARIEE